MLDFNIITALLIMVGVVLFVKFVMPYLENNNIDFYEEIKLGLLIFGYTFRDEKIKAISKTALEVVKSLENLSLTAEEKHFVAIEEVFRKLLFEFDIEVEEEVVEMIIRVAVAQLPATNI